MSLKKLSSAFHDELQKIAGFEKQAFLGAAIGAATAKRGRRLEGAGKGFLVGDALVPGALTVASMLYFAKKHGANEEAMMADIAKKVPALRAAGFAGSVGGGVWAGHSASKHE